MPGLQRKHANQVESEIPHSYILPLQRSSDSVEIGVEAFGAKYFGKPNSQRRGKLKRRECVRRMKDLAGLCGDKEVSQQLDTLSQIIGDKASDSRKTNEDCSFLGDCLRARTRWAHDADQWLLGEAVIWGLVWFTGRFGVDHSAEQLIEDLVQIGEAGLQNVAKGELSAIPYLLTLGELLKDVADCQHCADVARENLYREVQEHVGNDGGVGLEQSSEILSTVTRWVRCRDIIHTTSGKKLVKEINKKIDKAVTFAVLLLCNSGRAATEVTRESQRSVAPILQAASRGRKKVAATVLALLEGKNAAGDVRWTEKGLCQRSLFDEKQRIAVFRSGWKRGATRVLVSYRDQSPYLEIVAGDRLVIAGRWDIELRCNGKELPLVGAWRRTWWDANDNAIYLEMSVDVEGGWRLERSVLLLPKDKVVLLADAVVVPELKYGDESEMLAADLQLQSSLCVTSSIKIDPCEETCEVFGSDAKPRFLAVPLALDEWRESSRGQGSLSVSGQQLDLKLNAAAGRLYAPLWIDCNARRLKQLQEQPECNQRTWRQLTVADTREAISADQAVSFRVQSCLDQWFVYRSLDEARNRTALGCNMSSEFLVGRIAKNGVVKRLLEVVEDRVLY